MACPKCHKDHDSIFPCALIDLARANVSMTLADVPLVFLDVETTGFAPQRDRIVEISMLKIKGGAVVQTFDELIDPERQIPSAATAVHGIDMWKVMNQPPFAHYADALAEILTDQCVVVGHNINFDLGFLNWEIARAGRPSWQWQGLSFDTLRLARRLYHFENNKLGHLATKLGVDVGESHRAGADVATTAGVFGVICDRIRPNETELTVKHVMQAQGGYFPSPVVGRPVSKTKGGR